MCCPCRFFKGVGPRLRHSNDDENLVVISGSHGMGMPWLPERKNFGVQK
jgi:hypothetical protein